MCFWPACGGIAGHTAPELRRALPLMLASGRRYRAMKCAINRNALRAISYMMAQEKNIYYLNAVCVEFSPLETRLIATNGHMLAAHRRDADGDNDGSGTFIIPDTIVDKLLRWKPISRRDVTPITVSIDEGVYTAGYHDTRLQFIPVDATYLDWRRAVPRGPFNGIATQLDARYVYAMHRAAEALLNDLTRNAYVSISHNGKKPNMVDADGKVVVNGRYVSAALVTVNGDPEIWREGANSGATEGTKGASDTFVAPHWGASAALVTVNGDPDFIGVIMPRHDDPLKAPPQWVKAQCPK